MKLLSEFLKIQKDKTSYKTSGMKNQTVDEIFHALSCNMMENRHSKYEMDVRPIMDALVSGDISVLENSENLMKFIVFFGHQITRTKAFRKYLSRHDPLESKQGNDTASE